MAAGSSGALAGSCWFVIWAENSGEGEAWEFGMDGWAEVTGGEGEQIGGVSSARTKAGKVTRTAADTSR